MHFSSLASLVLTASLAWATPTPAVEERATASCASGISDPQTVKSAFKSAGIVPDLIPSISPKVALSVAYGKKKVNLGTMLTTVDTAEEPKYSFTNQPGYPANTNYSLFLVDPDVPAKDNISLTYLHWYVAHNKPACLSNKDTDAVTIYEAPTPTSTTQHRYTFLLYREPKGYTPDVVLAQARPDFDVVTYASKAGLVLVGGNYFHEAITNTN